MLPLFPQDGAVDKIAPLARRSELPRLPRGALVHKPALFLHPARADVLLRMARLEAVEPALCKEIVPDAGERFRHDALPPEAAAKAVAEARTVRALVEAIHRNTADDLALFHDRPMKDIGLFRLLFPRGKERPRKSDIFVRRPCEVLGDGGGRYPILIAHLRRVRAERAKGGPRRF